MTAIKQFNDEKMSGALTPGYGSVRIAPLMAIPSLLAEHATVPLDQLLAQLGLDIELFSDPENSISFATGGQLLNLCAEATDIPHFGLLLGMSNGPEVLGQLAELATHAPNVGTALYSIILHICLHDRGGVTTLSSSKGVIRFGYSIYVPMHHGTRHVYSHSLAVMCNLMRALCGNCWTPSEVRLSNSCPEDVTPYTSFFQAPVIFEAEEDSLLFPEHWLHHPLPNPDMDQHELIVKRLLGIESSIGIELLEELRSVMRPLIVSQTCTVTQVARIFSMHPRTLNRRLKALGTSFRQLVGDLRYDIAKHLLSDDDMSMIKISNTLGYANASEFTRAFKRWSGKTPTTWRSSGDA
jgi:AraC-like DNA-binding protein